MRQHRRPLKRQHSSPYRVNHFSTAFGLALPGGSTFGVNPVVSDTIVAGVNLLNIGAGGTVPGNQYRSCTIGGLRWSSEVLLNSAYVAGVAALAVVSECLYVSELDNTGVPTLGGGFFLQRNEFASLAQVFDYPERILWRRQYFMTIGATLVAFACYPNDGHPQVIKSKVRMSERDALVYRVEVSNPTATACTLGVQASAAIACKYSLD